MMDAVLLGIGALTAAASAVGLISFWRDTRYRRSPYRRWPGWMRACLTGSLLSMAACGVTTVLHELGVPVVGSLGLPATILAAVGVTAVALFGPRSTPAGSAASPDGSAPLPSAGPSVSPRGTDSQ